jgi:hypothetical protein
LFDRLKEEEHNFSLYSLTQNEYADSRTENDNCISAETRNHWSNLATSRGARLATFSAYVCLKIHQKKAQLKFRCFINFVSSHKPLNSFRLESEARYFFDIAYVKQLWQEGRWNEILDYVEPFLSQVNPVDEKKAKLFRWLIHRQRYWELIETYNRMRLFK